MFCFCIQGFKCFCFFNCFQTNCGMQARGFELLQPVVNPPPQLFSLSSRHQLHGQPICLLHPRLEVQKRVLQLGQHHLQQIQIFLNFSHIPSCHQLHCQPLCLLHLRLKVQENALKLGQHCLQQIQIFLNFSHVPSCHQLPHQLLSLLKLGLEVQGKALQLGQHCLKKFRSS